MDDFWVTKSEDVGVIVRTISFQDFQPMSSWSTNVTDRRTDDMRSQDRALHYSALRGKMFDFFAATIYKARNMEYYIGPGIPTVSPEPKYGGDMCPCLSGFDAYVYSFTKTHRN